VTLFSHSILFIFANASSVGFKSHIYGGSLNNCMTVFFQDVINFVDLLFGFQWQNWVI
jgi:hypothetical protein